jgi:hypothetical protein
MISYRSQLKKIGILPGTPVSYRNFISRPASFRQALRSMDAPATDSWTQVQDLNRAHQNWVDEVQGVTWDGANWIFSCNSAQLKPYSLDKSLFVFEGGSKLYDSEWKQQVVYYKLAHPYSTDENKNHYGPPIYYNNQVFIGFFFNDKSPHKGEKYVLRFDDVNGFLQNPYWIKIQPISNPDKPNEQIIPELVAINPWDGCMYLCLGEVNPKRAFIYDLNGNYLKRYLTFFGGENRCAYTILTNGGIVTYKYDMPSNIQGGCFTPNGHFFISCDIFVVNEGRQKAIAYFSALNGYLMGYVRVLAEESNQELEGMCYAAISNGDGKPSQIHAILLENNDVEVDNIFFKSFSTTRPDLI